MKRTRKKGTLLMILGLLLIAAALFLTGYNIWDGKRAGKSTDRILKEMSDTVNGNPVEEEEPDYVKNPGMEIPMVQIDGRRYIGILSIPAVQMELPVMSEWSYPGLRIAPCRYSGSVYSGHMVIAAHNYSTHFGLLKKVSIGDEVRFTDAEGHVFSYQVAGMETLMPTAVEDMDVESWPLTLFTCTLGGKSRFTVRCNQVTE